MMMALHHPPKKPKQSATSISNQRPLACAGHPLGHPVPLPAAAAGHTAQSHATPESVHVPAPYQLVRGVCGTGEQTLRGTSSHGHVSLTMVGCGVGGVQIGSCVKHATQSHGTPLSVHVLPVPG